MATGCKNDQEAKFFLIVLSTLLWVANDKNISVKMEYLIGGHQADHDDIDDVETGLGQCIGIRFWFGNHSSLEFATLVVAAIESKKIVHAQMPIFECVNAYHQTFSYLTDSYPTAFLPASGTIRSNFFNVYKTKCYQDLNDKQKPTNKDSLYGKHKNTDPERKYPLYFEGRFPYPKMTYKIPSSMLHPDIFFNTVLPRFKGSTVDGRDGDQWKSTSLELLLKQCPEFKINNDAEFCDHTTTKKQKIKQ